jgi:hypothetical protein
MVGPEVDGLGGVTVAKVDGELCGKGIREERDGCGMLRGGGFSGEVGGVFGGDLEGRGRAGVFDFAEVDGGDVGAAVGIEGVAAVVLEGAEVEVGGIRVWMRLRVRIC